MKKILLAGLLISALANCSKKDPDPTPTPAPATATLIAKWQVDSTWVSGGTQATFYKKNQLQVYSKGAASVDITKSQYILYVGNAIDKQWPYTQAGNVITNTSGMAPFNMHTIAQLTATRLVLVAPSPDTGGKANPYLTSTTTYSR